ncbi:hypothetical protein GGI15_003520 [Coemansia interrupta]|uniref:Uncharacterized protein n=1 Tax=Coemansia interrupta TaxID=1126814 RepID=A0A9W8H960_9FUNG|nr:hypothetical protein GGI15_003520 [Coemansia interrupta]
MSSNFTNNETSGGNNSNRQAAPIPIGSSGPARGGIGFQMSSSNQFSSGSHMAGITSGIDAPPNSLAAGPSMAGPMLPSSINFNKNLPVRAGAPESYSSQHGGMAGISSGIDAPPNSLAAGHSMAGPMLPSSINFNKNLPIRTGAPESYGGQQGTMAPPNSLVQGSKLPQIMENKGAGQVPSGSFIDRRIHAFGRVGDVDEADENAMDQDQDNSMDDISPASFHGPESGNMSSRYNEDMFQME